MWQHRWALWSGFLASTASCFIKLGLSKESPLLQLVQIHICERFIYSPSSSLSSSSAPLSWLVDLDEFLLGGIHYVLGELMIKYRINLMPYWKSIRTNVIEDIAIRLHLFEVDYVQLFIFSPIRLICIVAMIITNARGLKESGTVAGSSLSTAANFACYVRETLVGGTDEWEMVYRIFVCIANVQSTNDVDETATATTTTTTTITSNAKKVYDGKIKHTRTMYPSSSPAAAPSNNSMTTNIKKGKVANMRRSFTDIGSPPENISTSSSKPVIPVTPSPRQTSRSSIPFKTTTKKTKVKENLKPESSLTQYYPQSVLKSSDKKSSSVLINRSFLNECALCEGPLFDEITGISTDSIADLSTNTCFHLFHSKCLKQTSKSYGNACPLCEKPLAMWNSSKQAAHFPGFWLERVERYLHAMGKAPQDPTSGKEICLPVSTIRNYFLNHANDEKEIQSLTQAQKEYINDDPTGMGKGLISALEWGGSIDYNIAPKSHTGFSKALRTRGIWKYDQKKDDIWFWEWGSVHPRQRCDQCQLIKRPLPVQCQGCQGSAEAAYYCSESCAKRDKQRHKQTCEECSNNNNNNSSSNESIKPFEELSERFLKDKNRAKYFHAFKKTIQVFLEKIVTNLEDVQVVLHSIAGDNKLKAMGFDDLQVETNVRLQIKMNNTKQ
ncbi:hypothetical protein FRACYDRAFT_234586 [Fragilariopsis cylindrus CCMP1102]|uniref:RING-type domain-containing protein n=1 Tax=Fragilariopsis cylindrus CCMP1102 TaxID=635003 RepID=A0A1E7FS72_9STRA|nr:hypothetical protein FRACYDRAFT_234586 [Fragilariopsis cylindrus CCMP1102]|eukprot:OEU20955.1 hypothetical protein FRACYDRAFT_234586 [Fragilariopsis cylindrus CCMP1102]